MRPGPQRTPPTWSSAWWALRPLAAARLARGGRYAQHDDAPNGNIAPPGYYMLFLLDSAGVPSKARFIQLSPYTTPPPS